MSELIEGGMMDDITQRLANALRVLIWTSDTRDWLKKNDRKALEQAIKALAGLPDQECLFPDSHEPGHSKNMKFHVLLDYGATWEDLTEAEIQERLGLTEERGHSFTTGSQWDFWWED